MLQKARRVDPCCWRSTEGLDRFCNVILMIGLHFHICAPLSCCVSSPNLCLNVISSEIPHGFLVSNTSWDSPCSAIPQAFKHVNPRVLLHLSHNIPENVILTEPVITLEVTGKDGDGDACWCSLKHVLFWSCP